MRHSYLVLLAHAAWGWALRRAGVADAPHLPGIFGAHRGADAPTIPGIFGAWMGRGGFVQMS